ncbi:MAG: PVC-type heme-binding CxxCH protein [Bacteroidota bacterium]
MKKSWLPTAIVCLFLMLACTPTQPTQTAVNPPSEPSLSEKFGPLKPDMFMGLEMDGTPRTIALLGGTLISRMDKYGWFEALATAYWPDQPLTFRNLGWPADDVEGTARAEFGSAHNTKSWKPPDPEEGYGFEVIQEHIGLVNPDVLILGYGSEAAFATSDQEFQTFVSGYIRLLDELEQHEAKLILLSPSRHWTIEGLQKDISKSNIQLEKATNMIQTQAEKRGHHFIDLFSTLDHTTNGNPLSDNGIHLNSIGYGELAKLLTRELGISQGHSYQIVMRDSGEIKRSVGIKLSNFVETSRGIRFDALSKRLSYTGEFKLDREHLIKIDGKIERQRNYASLLSSSADLAQWEELRSMIIEKNRLHRFRINPLNKVYTHLFRQHEMGHLAYETDDYRRLVEEKDELIARLKQPRTRRYEVVFLEDWTSPRDYPDHEVPSYIPEPDPKAELAAFSVSEGMELNLFASDPMIANPISITWDNQGRAWVGTSTTYPQIKPGLEPVDRVVILEDTDQDGVADKSTVFAEGILIPHSVMPVQGGAYVSNTTELMFLADHDGDDKADESRVIYSGFGHGDVHHTIHCMRWAPWGDLYFSQSININSFVETPYGFRKINGSGFWEFRPETERLDVFAKGMINPWGQAFDDWGQILATDGAGSEGPTYIFPGSAHRTAVGMDRILPGTLTGKPKNTAAEFITGSHLPDSWKGSLMANDFRANRTVRYQITDDKSGYSAKEVETVLHSAHRSYRPVDNKIGPDGAMYIVDWYSPIIDHGEVDFYHPSRDKSHGRIWRLTQKNQPLHPVISFKEASDAELLEHLKSDAQFDRIHANRELVERTISQSAIKAWVLTLNPTDPAYDHQRLEALWLGIAVNEPDPALLSDLLESDNHKARAAAVRMIPRTFEDQEAEKEAGRMIADAHPQVRLEAITALRVLQSPKAAELAMKSLTHPMDANLEYALWLTARELESQWLPSLSRGEIVFGGDFQQLSFALNAANNTQATQSLAMLVQEGKLTGKTKKQALLTIANLGTANELELVLETAAKEADQELLSALLNAPADNTAKPSNTAALEGLLTHDNARIRTTAVQLFKRWAIPIGKDLLVQQASNPQAGIEERMAAADALVSQGEISALKKLANHSNTAIRSTAIASWAQSDPKTSAPLAAKLLTETSSISNAQIIFGAFCSMEQGPDLIGEQLTGKSIHSDVALRGIRVAQSTGRDLSALVSILNQAGDLKPLGMFLTQEQRKKLLSDVRKNGNARNGKNIYYRPALICATCHEINGEGGKVGPDLSSLGAYMTPESILESILNPNTDIKQGYETVVVTKKDGTVIGGTLDRKTESGALIRDAIGNLVTVANSEIENMEVSSVSMMPPGLVSSLRYDELVDLMTYLTNLGK